MTPEQQRLVRYAEAMGWKRSDRCSSITAGQFQLFGPQLWRGTESNDYLWNPLTDANDALELAEKMDLQFERRCDVSGKPSYLCWLCAGSRVQRRDTLPAAICAAVDAALEAK